MSGIIFKGPDCLVPITLVQQYSDGTPMVKTEGFENIVNGCDTMILRPHNLDEFVVAMFLIDSIWAAGGRIKKLILPYVPGARQDRSNPTGDVLFTAKSVAQMINYRGFESVVILDPHSRVIVERLLTPTVYPLYKVAEKLSAWHYDGVIAPDKGAVDRAGEVADTLNLPLITASKVRDVSTGALSGFEVNVRPGHYLVADDICDGGGTFVGLGEKIWEQDASADLYVSHGIFSKGTNELKRYYENIYTTDSRFFHERNDVKVIEVVEDMENYND